MKATMDENGCVVLIAQNSLEHYALKQHKVIEDRRSEGGAPVVVYDFESYVDVEKEEVMEEIGESFADSDE